jgi:hypothetical protein
LPKYSVIARLNTRFFTLKRKVQTWGTGRARWNLKGKSYTGSLHYEGGQMYPLFLFDDQKVEAKVLSEFRPKREVYDHGDATPEWIQAFHHRKNYERLVALNIDHLFMRPEYTIGSKTYKVRFSNLKMTSGIITMYFKGKTTHIFGIVRNMKFYPKPKYNDLIEEIARS